MWRELFSQVRNGTCLYCQEPLPIIGPLRALPPHIDSGVCDVCSYALRHSWQRTQGERIAALCPRVVRSYVLIPRIAKGRVETDLSAYEFLTDLEGKLPYAEWTSKEGSVAAWLETAFGVTTWPTTLKTVYLGYSGSADFSEVVLAWAWGKSLSSRRSSQERHKFASFNSLLSIPTPDAGFHLGIKTAFEALLWRLEMQPEGNKLCVVMRELAMNYLRSKKLVPTDGLTDDEDLASMSDAFRASMTTDELTVAALLTKTAEEAREAEVRLSSPPPVSYAMEEPSEDDSGEELSEGETAEAPEVEEGFARPFLPRASDFKAK